MTKQYNSNYKIFQQSDILYSSKIGTPAINALRVEQGEFIVAPIYALIGTYNVQQCVVVYIREDKSKLHGLAHIDGHTEVHSIDFFINSFNVDSSLPYAGLNITIIGGFNSSSKAGLNNSINNINKVTHFLESHNLIYNKIEAKVSDFVFDTYGMLIQAIPSGNNIECRSLHILQALKRKNLYLGTYPLISGCSEGEQNPDLYLDQRSVKFLNSYNQNFDVKEFEGSPISPQLFNSSTITLIQYRNNSINQLLNCSSTSNKEVFFTIPLSISLRSTESQMCQINNMLFNVDSALWRENSSIMNKEKSQCTVSNAINIATAYDNNLNSNCIIALLAENYHITPQAVLLQQFDAIITAKSFFLAIRSCNSKLYSHIIHFSEEYNAFEPSEITVQHALNNPITESKVSTIDIINAVIVNNNNIIMAQISNIEIENKHSLIMEALSRIGELPIDSRASDIMESFVTTSTSLSDWQKKIKSIPKLDKWFNNKIELELKKEIYSIAEEELKAKIYNYNTQFYQLRDEVKDWIGFTNSDSNLFSFNEYTFANIMAFSEYEVKPLKYDSTLIEKYCNAATNKNEALLNLYNEINMCEFKLAEVPPKISENINEIPSNCYDFLFSAIFLGVNVIVFAMAGCIMNNIPGHAFLFSADD